jgi:hypothetical protein
MPISGIQEQLRPQSSRVDGRRRGLPAPTRRPPSCGSAAERPAATAARILKSGGRRKIPRLPWPGTRLGQHLRRNHPERESAIDEFVWQALSGESTALEDRVEPDLLRVADPLVERSPVRSDELRVFIREAIETATATGSVVIHARAASIALAGREGVLRVLVTAVGGDESEANRRTTRNQRGGRAARAPSGRCRARRLSPTLLRRAYRASDTVRPRHQHRPAQPRGRGRRRRASGGLTKAGRADPPVALTARASTEPAPYSRDELEGPGTQIQMCTAGRRRRSRMCPLGMIRSTSPR